MFTAWTKDPRSFTFKFMPFNGYKIANKNFANPELA